jgi:DNA gyrase subunit A
MDVLSALFNITSGINLRIIMLALVDGEPRRLSSKQALRVYLDHRLDVIRRRSEFDLARARERAHILEGLRIALDNLDDVIDTIRRSRTVETAHENLRKRFKLTDAQAQAILQMQLRRLAALERRKIEDEYKEKLDLIKLLSALLASPKMMRMEVARELAAIREKYADPRRTVVISDAARDVRESDFLGPNEDTWATLTEGGVLSRTFSDNAPRVTTEVKDAPAAMLASNTTHTLYLFTEQGMAATVPTNVLPQSEDLEQGTPYKTLCPLTAEERITSVLSLPPSLETGYLAAITEQGEVKRLHGGPAGRRPGRSFMDIESGDRQSVIFVTGTRRIGHLPGTGNPFLRGRRAPDGTGSRWDARDQAARPAGPGRRRWDRGRAGQCLGLHRHRHRQEHAGGRIPGAGAWRTGGYHSQTAERCRRTDGRVGGLARR